MQTVPYRQLNKEVRALFINEYSKCLDTGLLYKTELIYNANLVLTSKGHMTTKNWFIKVFKSYNEVQILSIPEFVKYFEVPNIGSLQSLYPEHYHQYKNFVKNIYEIYGLSKFEFQMNDLALLLMKDNAILSYDQGLGKTLCGLVWARIKKILDDEVKRSLYIVQQDLIQQWQNEGERVGFKLKKIDSSNSKLEDTGNYITYYEFLRKSYDSYRTKFQLIILDEAHKVKSGDAIRGKAIRCLESKYKLCLSGTPIKNITQDLHYLLGWLYGFNSRMYPYAENEQSKFKKDYSVFEIVNGRKVFAQEISNLYELQIMLAPIILRRDITEIGVKIAKTNLYLIGVEFSIKQKQEYQRMLNKNLNQTSRDYNLRLNCTIYPGNNKLNALQIIVKAILCRNEQVIIFTGLVKVGEKYIQIFGDQSRLVNGKVVPEKREKIVKEFKEQKFSILVAGLECMNSGHNLPNCNNVIVTDYPWTSSVLDQAFGRVRRIISSKDINIFMLYTKNSIDEKMIELIDNKRECSKIILDGINNYECSYIDWNDLTK